MSQFDLDQFLKDRDGALLSLDADRIEAYAKKYGVEFFGKDHDLFWPTVHKAITANKNLPIEFRRKSKEYLNSIGYRLRLYG